MIRMMLLGVCVLYGLVIAWIFNNGVNFNQIWIWTSFILFVINNETLNGLLVKIGLFKNQDNE